MIFNNVEILVYHFCVTYHAVVMFEILHANAYFIIFPYIVLI